MFWFFAHRARGILAPQPGIKPAPTALEGKASTTGLPGKSHVASVFEDPGQFNSNVKQLHTEDMDETEKTEQHWIKNFIVYEIFLFMWECPSGFFFFLATQHEES